MEVKINEAKLSIILTVYAENQERGYELLKLFISQTSIEFAQKAIQELRQQII